ncbi:MAG: hypothetical protein HQL40_05980 [Alphaproteobacteria bacterium]|nr:hypothetical protein [Alphaproteobacteria bacterium]
MNARVVTRTECLTPEEEAVHAVSTAVLEMLAERFPRQPPEVAIGGLVSATLTTAVMSMRTAVTIDVLRGSADDLANPANPIHVLSARGRH